MLLRTHTCIFVLLFHNDKCVLCVLLIRDSSIIQKLNKIKMNCIEAVGSETIQKKRRDVFLSFLEIILTVDIHIHNACIRLVGD